MDNDVLAREQPLRSVIVLVDRGALRAGEDWIGGVLRFAGQRGVVTQCRVYHDWSGGGLAGEVKMLYRHGATAVQTPDPAVQLAIDAVQDCPAGSVAVLAGATASLLPVLPLLAARSVEVVLLTADQPSDDDASPVGVRDRLCWHALAGPPPAAEVPPVVAGERANGAVVVPLWEQPGWTVPVSSGVRSLERRIRDLQRVLEQIGEPPEGTLDDAACRIEASALRLVTDNIDERWGGFTADQQRALLGMSAARIKHLQEQQAVIQDDELAGRLTRTFGALTRFSKEFMPGAVHGLARAHKHRHDSWAGDAREFYDTLCELAGMVSEQPEEERARLLQELAAAVAMWCAALPEERTVPAAEVADRARACFRGGIARTDQELVRIVAPAARDLRATDFKALREAVKQLEREQEPPAPAESGAPAVCSNAECLRLVAARSAQDSQPVEVEPAECSICANSNDRRAMLVMADALHRNNLERLLVVGGSPGKRTELEQTLSGEGLHLRCVDGTGHSNTREAVNNLNWCQVAVIWGGTELDHKISDLYTDNLPSDVVCVTPIRRGIEALCRDVVARVDG